MKKQKKLYSRPKRPWDKERIQTEKKIMQKYGLRRKKEVWRVVAILRNFRTRARLLIGKSDKLTEKAFITKLADLGLVQQNANLDSVLALTIENILDRRLQTIIHKKGLANTIKQSRQFIVHGHIVLNGKRITWPSTLVSKSDEDLIALYTNSPLKNIEINKNSNVKGEK